MQQGVRRSLGRARKVRAALLVFGLAFFAPYFAFAAIEGAYVHSVSRAEILG